MLHKKKGFTKISQQIQETIEILYTQSSLSINLFGNKSRVVLIDLWNYENIIIIFQIVIKVKKNQKIYSLIKNIPKIESYNF